MEKGDLFFCGFWEVNKRGIERIDIAFGKIFKKATESNKMITLSEWGESGFFWSFVTIETETEFAQKLTGDIFWRHVSFKVLAAEF